MFKVLFHKKIKIEIKKNLKLISFFAKIKIKDKEKICYQKKLKK
jgi:hypothetical protein